MNIESTPPRNGQGYLHQTHSTLIQRLADPSFDFDSLDWESYGADERKGVEILRLYDTRAEYPQGPAAALLRYSAGAKVAAHLHPGYELIYVLRGELVNDAGIHGEGTLEICPPGSRHALSSDKGCIFLVVWEQPVTVL